MRKFHLLLILSAVGFMSCEKLVEIPLPGNSIVSSQIYKDSSTVYSTIMGLYSYLIHGNNTDRSAYAWRMTTMPSLSADELYYFPGNTTLEEFTNNSILPENSNVNVLWNDCYRVINVANAIVQGAEGSTTLSTSFRNQAIGEAKTLRAFSYFMLVNFLGDVPLVIVSDYEQTSKLPRTPKADVYKQIIEDLLDAQSKMPSNYHPVDQRTRINKDAATTLLARAYLYTGDWQKAEQQASSVINNTTLYNMADPLDKAFLATSKQIIWSLHTVGSGSNATILAGELIPSSGTATPTYVFRNEFLNSFETGDLRRTAWIKSHVFNGTTYYHPYKYKARSVSTANLSASNQEFQIVLRLSELYLIRAEARAQLNKITGANSAETDLNVIRNKAGLPNTTATTQAAMLAAIEQERKVELFAEWGHRWFDLIRTGRANAVLGFLKGSFWQATDILYPIPNFARNLNDKLTQNMGYN